MTNTASDLVNAALGSYGFVFEAPGYFARYTKTATGAVVKSSFIVPSTDGLSFTSCTEDGATFTSTEEELLRAFPGRTRGIPGGERSAN
jgi:hypothetical protein